MTTKSTVTWSALSGVASAAAGLAIAELVSAFLAPASSPLVAVGSLVIDIAPGWAKDFAIAVFGTNDKIFLLTLLAVLLVVVAAAAGVLELRKTNGGRVVFALLGVVASVAVLTREQSTAVWAAPTVLGMLGAILLLRQITKKLTDWVSRTTPTRGPAERRPIGTSRRDFVIYVASTAIGAAVVGIGSRAINAAALAADAVRKAIKLPRPVAAAPPIPEGAALDVEGVTPLITPNENFYRIDTALQVPHIDPTQWTLRITGMVDNPVSITFDELLELPLTETNVTLMCVSNEVGGDLAGNATWLGYPIREMLKKAKPQAGADMVLSHSIDGFTASTPLAILEEKDRDCLLAVGMNGEPLPQEHGFPVRMVVPGLYGYVSATKWLVELEVTTFDRSSAYWTDRGWSARGPIKISSRIDVPSEGSNPAAGNVAVAGVAWAQHTGIAAVEVRVDDGEWMPARLAKPISTDTWVQWVYTWEASSGAHTIQARAIDSEGTVQSGDDVGVIPNGAEGWHTVRVDVA